MFIIGAVCGMIIEKVCCMTENRAYSQSTVKEVLIQMNKKISLGVAVSIAAIVAAFAVVITYTAAIRVFDSRMSSVTERQNMYKVLSEIDMTVRQNYYGDISENYLQKNISQGYVLGLDDPYSKYLSADEYQLNVNESLGYTFGLGMDVDRSTDGYILVNVVYKGSPADKAGIKAGDIIVSVENKDVLTVGYDKAILMISEASPKVSVVLSRGGKKSAYELTRSKFETKSVVQRVTGESIGVIKIYEFNAKTPDQFNSALNKLRNQNITGLIIDLRDNASNNYQYACEILDTLLPAGKLMSVTGKDGNSSIKYTSDTQFIDLPMEVLINDGTDGAAELFSAVMMNYGAAESIGTKTAGHDTVQELFRLSNGCAVRVTTGRWSDDLGGVISDGKVVPQFEVGLTSYQKANRYLLSDESDPQLQTALDRIYSAIASRKEAQEEEVTPTDSTSTTAKASDKTEKTTKDTKASKTTKKKKKG